MDERDARVAIPEECVTWCRAQDYQVVVGDDWAKVDLDWWNHRLADYAIPVRLSGLDLDGTPTATGIAYLRRGDLHGDTVPAHGDTVPAHGPADLRVLYTAAAWLSGHRDRDRARRFPDVRTTTPGHELDVITGALAGCRQSPPMSAPQGVPGRRWSGWPHTPGVGPTVLSLYHWAVHHDTTRHDTTGHGTAAGHHGTAGHGIVGPQLLDQQAVASLIHLGWVGNPVAARFTWVQYTRYCHLLHAWATQGDVTAELIEMWLVARWRDRTTQRTPRANQQHR